MDGMDTIGFLWLIVACFFCIGFLSLGIIQRSLFDSHFESLVHVRFKMIRFSRSRHGSVIELRFRHVCVGSIHRHNGCNGFSY